jgi:hypothetical protein
MRIKSLSHPPAVHAAKAFGLGQQPLRALDPLQDDIFVGRPKCVRRVPRLGRGEPARERPLGLTAEGIAVKEKRYVAIDHGLQQGGDLP